jgi:hypothetical protein
MDILITELIFLVVANFWQFKWAIISPKDFFEKKNKFKIEYL